MKNPTSGDFSVMLNSVYAAQHPHSACLRAGLDYLLRVTVCNTFPFLSIMRSSSVFLLADTMDQLIERISGFYGIAYGFCGKPCHRLFL